jgi:hypothetical protein
VDKLKSEIVLLKLAAVATPELVNQKSLNVEQRQVAAWTEDLAKKEKVATNFCVFSLVRVPSAALLCHPRSCCFLLSIPL